MKKIFLTACLLMLSGFAIASADNNLVVLQKGETFTYPIKNGQMLECYAKRIDGSIDDFEEYNDYFKMVNGKLYSDTMNKIYKAEKKNLWKKVDRASLIHNGKTLQLYDPLWEGSIRHHMRTIKIDLSDGKYYMKGTQDNWMWYRNITATGYCRVIDAKD